MCEYIVGHTFRIGGFTIDENLLIDSSVGRPDILGESVSKYTARDCSLASCWRCHWVWIGWADFQHYLVNRPCCTLDEGSFPFVIHRDCCETCQGDSSREGMLWHMMSIAILSWQNSNYPWHTQVVFISYVNILNGYLDIVDNLRDERLKKALRLGRFLLRCEFEKPYIE